MARHGSGGMPREVMEVCAGVPVNGVRKPAACVQTRRMANVEAPRQKTEPIWQTRKNARRWNVRIFSRPP